MLTIIQAAGWPIWPLILCSIVGLALIIERLMTLRSRRILPPRLLDEVMAVTRTALPPMDVVGKLAENSVLGRVLAAGLASMIAEPRLTEQALRQTFESAGRAAAHDHAHAPQHGGVVRRVQANQHILTFHHFQIGQRARKHVSAYLGAAAAATRDRRRHRRRAERTARLKRDLQTHNPCNTGYV